MLSKWLCKCLFCRKPGIWSSRHTSLSRLPPPVLWSPALQGGRRLHLLVSTCTEGSHEERSCRLLTGRSNGGLLNKDTRCVWMQVRNVSDSNQCRDGRRTLWDVPPPLPGKMRNCTWTTERLCGSSSFRSRRQLIIHPGLCSRDELGGLGIKALEGEDEIIKS